MAAIAAASSRGQGRTLSIGQVLQRLNVEFPELSPSKLRFLEDKGLVHPERTPKGYRKFSAGDVARLREVLTMQRDLYLPLKVIAEYFDALDRGLEPELPGSRAPQRQTMLAAGTVLDRAQLLERSGAKPLLLEQAVSAGLIPAASRYQDDELTMLSTLVELEKVGIEPRHLRPFRAAAHHEFGLIEQALSTSSRRSRSGGETSERANELAEHLESVRRSLIRQAVRGRR